MSVKGKKIEGIPFGVMLALANDHKAFNAHRENLSRTDQNAIEALSISISAMKDKNTVMVHQAEMPKESCPVGDSFIMNHKELLLQLFSGCGPQDVCGKLIDHMNRCMCCLEFFGETLRDFHNASTLKMSEE